MSAKKPKQKFAWRRPGALLSGENPGLGIAPLLAQVVYDKDAKIARIRALADRFNELCEQETSFDKADLMEALASALWKVAPTFKHHAFEEEHEWRVVAEVQNSFFAVSSSANAIEFLDDQRPYIVMDLGVSEGANALDFLNATSFEGAIIGPSRNARANSAIVGAALMKRQFGYSLDTSEVPYRGR